MMKIFKKQIKIILVKNLNLVDLETQINQEIENLIFLKKIRRFNDINIKIMQKSLIGIINYVEVINIKNEYI